jgi:hypothetical protein
MGAPLLHVGGVFFAGLLSWRRFANERAAGTSVNGLFSLSKREIGRKKKNRGDLIASFENSFM